MEFNGAPLCGIWLWEAGGVQDKLCSGTLHTYTIHCPTGITSFNMVGALYVYVNLSIMVSNKIKPPIELMVESFKLERDDINLCLAWVRNASSLILGHVYTSDYDDRFLKSLIGGDMGGNLTLVYTRSPKIKVIIGKHVNKWMRKWHEILHEFFSLCDFCMCLRRCSRSDWRGSHWCRGYCSVWQHTTIIPRWFRNYYIIWGFVDFFK